MNFKLRFARGKIIYWTISYREQRNEKHRQQEDKTEQKIAPRIKDNKSLGKENFLLDLQLEGPTPSQMLRGVNWPTASVFLHFCGSDRYPILDFRALWSLNAKVPSQYTFEHWWGYVQAVRGLQEASGLSMRIVDRALWQYSKENQR